VWVEDLQAEKKRKETYQVNLSATTQALAREKYNFEIK